MDVQKVTSDFVRLRDVLTFTVWALNFSFVSCQPWVQQVHPPKEQWGTKCDLSGQWSRGTNRRQKGDYQGHPLTIKYCKYLKQTALKFTRMHQNQCYLQKLLDGRAPRSHYSSFAPQAHICSINIWCDYLTDQGYHPSKASDI